MAVTIKGFASDWSVPEPAKPGLDNVSAAFAQDASSATGVAISSVVAQGIDKANPHGVDLLRLGAQGLNTVSNTQFKAAIDTVRAGRRLPPANTGSDYLGTKTINIPAGDYRVTELLGLMGTETQSIKIHGLRFKGAGSNLTNIIFDPSEDGAMAFNNYWINIKFEGMTFRTMRPNCTWMRSYTTNAAQKYSFTDVAWYGPWKYVFDLQGNNNNSEFTFHECQTAGMQDDGAFLYIGATNTSDQFLNYWFFGFKHWSTSAPLIDAARGGHFHGYGVDASDWGANATTGAPRYLFNLRGATHNAGVESLTMHGLRVEAKAPAAALLYSEWAGGNVEIQCDWSSQMSSQTYGDIIVINLGNVPGPVYKFHNSRLAGGIRVRYGPNAFRYRHQIVVEDTTWHQRLTPSEVVTYDRSATTGNNNDPQVHFVRCRGDSGDVYSDNGVAVWDATVSHNMGDLVRVVQERTLSIHGTYGNIKDTDTGGFNAALPVGAIITGMTVMAPAGDTTEGDGGTWNLTTDEATPTPIASVTVGTARNLGYKVRTDLAVPFLCANRTLATLMLKSTGVSQSGRNSMVLVHGYW